MAWTRRQFLYRTTVLGAAAVTGCSSRVGGTPRADPAAHVAEPPSSAEEPARTVTLGVLNYPPYVVERDGEVTGPVPEVARAVLSQLGVTGVKIQLLRDEQVLAPMLATGRLDIVGGLAIRADLCANLSFSGPDYVSRTAFIVPTGNPKGLTTYADVRDKKARVAVMAHLPEQGDVARFHLPAASVVPVASVEDLLSAVREGRADCAAFDDLSARSVVGADSRGGLATARPFPPPGRLPLVGAYAFPKDSELLTSFNNRLRDLHASGDWLAIVAPFGLTEEHAPPPDLTTERVCAG